MTCYHFPINYSSYEALLGVVSHDYFDSMSDEELTTGITLPQRDRILKNFVRNQVENKSLIIQISSSLFRTLSACAKM